ncbi:MAG: FAD-binding oxidoreductase [Cyclobacteriaceae bacterium]
MLSIWEKESLISYDVIIVGAGISGLSTAASIKEKNKRLSVLILERGLLPTGASTKNAGFACFGSISELSQDRKTLGDDKMLSLVEKRWNGLKKTISRLDESKIGFEQKGGYELLDEKQTHYLEEIEQTNQLLKRVFKSSVYSSKDEKLKDFGFEKTRHLIHNQFEGQLHTGDLMKSLWEYCGELGVKIITGAEVQGYESHNKSIRVKTPGLNFECKSLGICTNAFTQSIAGKDVAVNPGRGMVLLVKPKDRLRFSGTFHYQEGYYYFRDFGEKLLFGGGRNLDFNTETTTDFGINELIEQQLHKLLQEVIIPKTSYEVETKWSGIMAFGETKAPIVSRLSEHVFLGIRLGGMGVAIGSIVGEELAQLILNDLD